MRLAFLFLKLFLLITLFLPSPLRAENGSGGNKTPTEKAEGEESSEKTILMDESLIVGVELGAIGGRRKRIPGPALSTALRWDGVAAETLDIPKEILQHLSQPDLSFFKNREILDDLNDDMRSDRDE